MKRDMPANGAQGVPAAAPRWTASAKASMDSWWSARSWWSRPSR